MTSTVFTPGTVITSSWLNDINKAVYLPSTKSTLGGITLSPFSFTGVAATTSDRHTVADTNPKDWSNGPGRMSICFDIKFNSFFSLNPNAHMAVVLRNTTSIIATQVRGQGIALGNATSFFQPSDLNPTPLVETWMTGLMPPAPSDNFLWSNSDGARSRPMADGIQYKIMIDAIKTNDDHRYVRYRVWSQRTATLEWQPEVDSGDVLDHNIWADLTQSGITFAYVFGAGVTGWSVDFTNATVTWGPAEQATPDQTTKLSRYGAQLEGDLQFIGNDREIRAAYNAGPALTNSLKFRSSTANTATTVVLIPNGTSTVANTLYSNASNDASTTYRAMYIGMHANRAELVTLNSTGGAATYLDFNIGSDNVVATVNDTGLDFVGSNRRLRSESAATPTSTFAFQCSTANAATTLNIIPNGSSTTANVLCSNNSAGGLYKCGVFGIEGSTISVMSLDLAGSSPPIDMRPGGATVASFTTAGMLMNGASLAIGTNLALTQTTYGGPNAAAGFALAAGGAIDMDTSSTLGYIAGYIGATYVAGNIENVIRPLYCILSTVIKDLKNKKVL